MSEGGGGNGTVVDAGPEAYLQHPAVIALDWIGFFILFGSSFVLVFKLMTFTGPQRNEPYFFGYRESRMISVYVNLFAALAYWAKVSSHANKDTGGASQIHLYKYADYIFTCPILTIDLLWTLNLPYKFTFGTNVFCCIICATCASIFSPPARYMWFSFGVCLFAVTWFSIITLVRMRLDQFYPTDAHAQDVSKSTKGMLKTALMVYFSIWCGYPTLWVLKEARIIDAVTSHCMHVFLDVFSKSAYGFALLKFQLSSEKREFNLAPLQGYGNRPGAAVFYDEEDQSPTKGGYDEYDGHQPTASKIRSYSDHMPPRMVPPGSASPSKRRFAPVPPGEARMESFPTPGQYMNQQRMLDVGSAGSHGPFRRFGKGGFDGSRKATDVEMASTMEQIQELNAQLSQMMSGQSLPLDQDDGNGMAVNGVPGTAGARMKQMYEQDVHGRSMA